MFGTNYSSKKPNKIKCRDILILNGLYFTLSTFADKNKNINFANNIYSYRSKYPYLFIYPKKVYLKIIIINYLLMT